MTLPAQTARPEPEILGLDGLTGLPGRERFTEDLARHLSTLTEQVALCVIDIDQFRYLNAVAGTGGGDLALQQIAGLLVANLAPTHLIGRTGDDEFAILFAGTPPQEAAALTTGLLTMLGNHRLNWGGRVFTFSACAGFAVASPADSVGDLLHGAMTACGAAKDAGRGSLVLAGDAGSPAVRYHDEARILTGLRSAFADDRLRLYAQEIFSLSATDADVLEFELLVHMIDRDGTEFPPSAIIPAAERHGYIRELDRWVVKAALTDCAALLQRNPNICLSVNLSGQSLADPMLWPYVATLFEQSGIPGARIQFEITETSAITNMAAALDFVHAARAHGCKVALDDFGSGLSSFVYLRTFPVDCIKIDGAFVAKVTDPDSADRAIVTAIVGVARDMGLTVVAEHVDSGAVLATLRQLGVDKVQGFLIAQPQPFAEMFQKA